MRKLIERCHKSTKDPSWNFVDDLLLIMRAIICITAMYAILHRP